MLKLYPLPAFAPDVLFTVVNRLYAWLVTEYCLPQFLSKRFVRLNTSKVSSMVCLFSPFVTKKSCAKRISITCSHGVVLPFLSTYVPLLLFKYLSLATNDSNAAACCAAVYRTVLFEF